MATAKQRTNPEPETTEEEEEMTASPRYLLFAEWLREEKGLDCDPLTLEIAQKNYGAFQRSEVNRNNNVRLAEEREKAIQERKAERERKAQEREEKRAAAEQARKEKAEADKAREAGAPTTGAATTTATKRAAAAKKAAPAAPAKTVGKPRAARAKGAASPF
jgi:hypothetical protein